MAVPTRVSRCHDRVINGSMGTRSETPCGDSIDYHQDIQINTEPSPLKEVLEGWVTAAPQWRGGYTNDMALHQLQGEGQHRQRRQRQQQQQRREREGADREGRCGGEERQRPPREPPPP
eukprot:COSAG04_NODE_15376_length_534_cov_0.577011_1_plen_118_part_10